MATSDDEYLRAGASDDPGQAATSTPPTDDQYVVTGRQAEKQEQQQTPGTGVWGQRPGASYAFPAMTWRGTARAVGAGGTDVAATVGNLLTDPIGNLVGQPLVTAGTFVHDLLAPYLGYDRFSPDERNYLTSTSPSDVQPGTRAVTAVGRAVGADPSQVQLTPAEQVVRAATGGGGTALVAGPGGVLAPIAGAVGAGAGEAAAQNISPWAAEGARLVANALAASTVAGSRGLRGVTTDVSPADAQLGQLAHDKYNIPITAGDLTSNPLYRITADQASKLPFSGATAADAAKRSAWQGAIATEMGEPNATGFTPDVMDRARTRIGQTFDGVAQRTNIDANSVNTLVGDLANIERDMHQTLPANELPPLKAQLDNILDVATKSSSGEITGAQYQALTRKGAPLDRAESSSDPNVAFTAGRIRDALDDAFVRSASPADQQTLAQAKYQYRIMRTVDPLAAGSRDGSISPDAFMQKVLTASRRFDAPTGGIAYTGGGNIGELARIGKLMRAPPQTGTADRALINLLALGGTALPPFLTNPWSAVGVPAMLAGNRLLGAYLRSGGLANRVITSAQQPPLPAIAGFAPYLATASNPPPQVPQGGPQP